MALAQDIKFIRRLQSIMLSEVSTILAEVSTTPNHVARRTFAQQVITNGQSVAQQFAPLIANSTNLVAANTTYDFTQLAVVTDATDAAILSQVDTLWNAMSGV